MTEDFDPINYGFRDQAEFQRLVANLDVSTPEKMAAFKKWQAEDCTKDGLLHLSEVKHAIAEAKPKPTDDEVALLAGKLMLIEKKFEMLGRSMEKTNSMRDAAKAANKILDELKAIFNDLVAFEEKYGNLESIDKVLP